jgi:amino acid transporter
MAGPFSAYEKSSTSPSPESGSAGFYDSRTHLSGGEPYYGDARDLRSSFGKRFVDSFRRDPTKHILGTTAPEVTDGRHWDPHAAAMGTAHSLLTRKLKGRHLQMIAIGGSVGKFLLIMDGRVR